MILYERERHEMLALKFYLDISADREEFENLLAKPMRSLTPFLNWVANSVKLAFELDEAGIWAAAWLEPYGDGAFFGAWIRPKMRGTIQAWVFINRAYRLAFEHFPVIVGLTRRPELDRLHRALGYVRVGVIPKWFDGKDAIIYALSKESYYGSRRRKDEHEYDQQPLRATVGVDRKPDVEDGEAGGSADGGANGRSAPHRRHKRAHPDDKQRDGVRASGVLGQLLASPRPTRAKRIVE
jgi:hypothetical protein